MALLLAINCGEPLLVKMHAYCYNFVELLMTLCKRSVQWILVDSRLSQLIYSRHFTAFDPHHNMLAFSLFY